MRIIIYINETSRVLEFANFISLGEIVEHIEWILLCNFH